VRKANVAATPSHPASRGVWIVVALLASSGARAQDLPTDTAAVRHLDEVLVTATRGARSLGGPAIPADVITDEDIEARGLVRLGDVFAELGGYSTVQAFGTGLQIQGLGPEYTLVLVDGEPVIGRLNGTLDLDRLGLAGVERVEVVRGPFSSLYGSDALAGVVNLISRAPAEPLRAVGAVRVESHGTTDASSDVTAATGSSHVGLTLRHYRSGAYDLDPVTPEPTFPAYAGAEAALRLEVRLPAGVQLRARGRAGLEDQRDGADVSLPLGSAPLTGQGLRTDASLSVALDRAMGRGVRVGTRFYSSRFRTETALSSGAGDTLVSRFEQWYHKGEAQVERVLGTAHLVTAGAGVVLESVAADRIGGGGRDTRGGFVFAQEQWRASERVDVTVSARLDAPGDYGARVSPAASVVVRPMPALSVRGSLGSGFKAPTFQQRYLDFTNAPAGYTVIGASDVAEVLARYEAEGLVERYENTVDLAATLRPEASRAINVGAEITPARELALRGNAFHNHVADLIDIVPVATLTNGRQVYTYVNIERVRTRGLELGADWTAASWLGVGIRYQYLDAVDLGVLDDIDAGRVFRRVDGADRRLRRGEYGGLFGRSRHSASIDVRARLPIERLQASLRGAFRSRYGDFDRNGNLVLDEASEYVRGYVLLNGTLSYAATGWLALQAGVENVLDYTDPQRAPALPGRRWFAGVRVTRVFL